MSITRSEFAQLLAQRLHRPHSVIDFGSIVIWKNRKGVLNHATMYYPPHGQDAVIVISQFKTMIRTFNRESDQPLVDIRCYDDELFRFVDWIVQWNQTQEDGQPAPPGVVSLFREPFVRGSSDRHHRDHQREAAKAEREFIAQMKNRKTSIG